ncbi:MAG TPA: uroporphyrinogen decarboxylase family protein, partial [Anaerolineae bacterium]|nr:uroporphyrinogen decarboxylase family protein [Anaerolineae bacterium]
GHTTWKCFIHSCGSVRAFLEDFIDAGFDILNPVQCSAACMDPVELKEEFGDKLTFWGGGVDTHSILPFGTPEQVREDVRRRIKIFGPGGGYVFASIHNILGDVSPQNILAAVDAAYEFGVYPIQAGPENPDTLAEHLTKVNYWPKPLKALQEGN